MVKACFFLRLLSNPVFSPVYKLTQKLGISCVTITTTDSMYENDEATDKYTHAPAVAEGGTRAEKSVYIRNGRQEGESEATYTQYLNADCSTKNASWSWSYANTAADLTDEIALSTARSSSGVNLF